MTSKSTRTILGPLNRVEGDLDVTIELEQNVVSQAWVNSPLFRGFERILLGKSPADSLVYTPRICGICSVAQSVAAANALANLQGLTPTTNGQTATNLILACENLADHLSHFYLFFMPDFARQGYVKKHWFEHVSARFKAQTGSSASEVLPARAAFMQMTGILAGKWPHSLSIQPGGTSRPVQSSEQMRLLSIITSFRRFLERIVFGDDLENISDLRSIKELEAWKSKNSTSDFSLFLQISDDLALERLGVAENRFLSFGAYAYDQQHLFKSGVSTLRDGQFHNLPFEQANISEDIANSWLDGEAVPSHPYQGTTEPLSNSDGYSWCKAPRFSGEVCEVGALARQVVNAHPLILELVKNNGANVQNRIIARLLELAIVVPQMQIWCSQLDANESYCSHANMPNNGKGAGFVEAARGSLGHWLQVKNGKLSNYQIIAPTTWNFSPRDAFGRPGALEQALVGLSVEGKLEDAPEIQHVIRSFDPCMVCTVH